jgi:DNA-binding CsgD family transcriptional regulator
MRAKAHLHGLVHGRPQSWLSITANQQTSMTRVSLLRFSTDRGENAIRYLSYAGRNALVICVDLVGVLQAAGALRKARDGDIFVLLDSSVANALLRVLPADEVTFSDLDVRAHHCALVDLLPTEAGKPHGEFWQHFWNTLSCSCTERAGRPRGVVTTTGDFHRDRQWHSTGMYTQWVPPGGEDKELVMPLPAPPGIARRLVFFRGPGPPFGDAERDAAVLLQPHIAEALRMQGRRAAQQPLTGRQRELLALVTAGHDNIAIACQLGLSPATVRKHLENAFTRLEVDSRTAAVAKICPDAMWR